MSQAHKCPDIDCDKTYSRRKSLTDGHFRLHPDHKPDNWTECPECGERYYRIANHWGGECDYPEISDYLLEIATGIMMGDGSVERTGSCSRLQVTGFTTPKYLEYLDELFGVVGCGVKPMKDSEEVADYRREELGDESAVPDNYSDQYCWRTRSHPVFDDFDSWYGTGKKVWPHDIDLTPVVLSHWFVNDGSLNDAGSNRISISMAKEYDNLDKVCEYFSDAGLPTPDRFDDTNRSIHWNVDSLMEIYDYMDGPLPGFDDKWPEEYR